MQLCYAFVAVFYCTRFHFYYSWLSYSFCLKALLNFIKKSCYCYDLLILNSNWVRVRGAALRPSGLVHWNLDRGWHWLISVHAVMLPCCFHWKDIQCVMEWCMWRCATWIMTSCSSFLLSMWSISVCECVHVLSGKTVKALEKRKSKWQRERKYLRMRQRCISYHWNSLRLSSLARTGIDLGQRICHGHTPWCSELLMQSTMWYTQKQLCAEQNNI